MKDTNVVVLCGRLTRDSELSYTQGGFAILKFSIAVNRSKKDGDKWVDEAAFFDVSLFGKMGESLANYLQKGKQVAIKGELRQDRWEAQDGTKRSKVYVDADTVQLLGGNTETHGSKVSGPLPDHADPASPQYQNKAGFKDDIPGDIPF